MGRLEKKKAEVPVYDLKVAAVPNFEESYDGVAEEAGRAEVYTGGKTFTQEKGEREEKKKKGSRLNDPPRRVSLYNNYSLGVPNPACRAPQTNPEAFGNKGGSLFHHPRSPMI